MSREMGGNEMMLRAGSLALSLGILLTLSSVSLADEKGDFDAEALFKSACAPCHGLKGDGDGPVSGVLKNKMNPLSGLTLRHGGEYPAEYVRKLIDGRVVVDAHGSRAMPVWGAYFTLVHKTVGASPSLSATESSNETIINALVEYIRSMQKS
jgi:mono/diheme cytochrome c family protein